MTLRHLNIFCAVCFNDCNTTKAAEALHMSQPAVSLAIRELEEYYNVLLFDRIGKRLKITEAGHQMYEYASHISELFKDMEVSLRNMNKKGIIRVGASISVGAHLLPEYVEEYAKISPDILVKVVIASSEQLEEQIASSDLDFALIEGLVHNPDIIARNFMEDSLVVLVSKDSPFENGQTLSLHEFRAQNFLLREQNSATRELFEAVTKQAGFAIVPTWESVSTTAIVNGVIKNMGITLLPERLVRGPIESGDVKIVNVEGLSFDRTFKIIYHKNKLITPPMDAFINIVRTYNPED